MRFHPGEPHQWQPRLDLPGTQATCSICELTMPRNAVERDKPRYGCTCGETFPDYTTWLDHFQPQGYCARQPKEPA
jgi:hypothetical protein